MAASSASETDNHPNTGADAGPDSMLEIDDAPIAASHGGGRASHRRQESKAIKPKTSRRRTLSPATSKALILQEIEDDTALNSINNTSGSGSDSSCGASDSTKDNSIAARSCVGADLTPMKQTSSITVIPVTVTGHTHAHPHAHPFSDKENQQPAGVVVISSNNKCSTALSSFEKRGVKLGQSATAPTSGGMTTAPTSNADFGKEKMKVRHLTENIDSLFSSDVSIDEVISSSHAESSAVSVCVMAAAAAVVMVAPRMTQERAESKAEQRYLIRQEQARWKYSWELASYHAAVEAARRLPMDL